MEEVDIVIIGAGVVGLAIASELAQSKSNIVVLERNNTFGQETSSRNSEVIHGGMHYPLGTLKAKLCIEGRRLLYEICKINNIPHKKIGKLIVATEKEEISCLETLLLQGRENGVEGLRVISQYDLERLEPNVSGLSALYSEETGIIDSHRLMQYFVSTAKNKGAMIVYNCEVKGIDRLSAGYKILINNDKEVLTLKSETVINCAGLDSDKVAEMVGIDIKKSKYGLHYCKGQYFRVKSNKSALIERLIYPVPQPLNGCLGVHATLDLGGGLRLGPDDLYLNDRIKDYSVNPAGKMGFYNAVNKFLPFIEEDDLYEDISGIRPKLQEEGGLFRDFVIQEESDKGFSGFFNLIGIESPGLTASPAIARYLKELIR